MWINKATSRSRHHLSVCWTCTPSLDPEDHTCRATSRLPTHSDMSLDVVGDQHRVQARNAAERHIITQKWHKALHEIEHETHIAGRGYVIQIAILPPMQATVARVRYPRSSVIPRHTDWYHDETKQKDKRHAHIPPTKVSCIRRLFHKR